jgi:hypothetical protein
MVAAGGSRSARLVFLAGVGYNARLFWVDQGHEQMAVFRIVQLSAFGNSEVRAHLFFIREPSEARRYFKQVFQGISFILLRNAEYYRPIDIGAAS